jgi:hypothetical protein
MDGRYGVTARRGPRATLLVAATLLALALTLTGCGSGKGDSGIATASGAKPQVAASAAPSSSADREEALRQFAQCMRDNGVQMNDPDPNGGGFGFGGGGGGQRGGGGFRADFNDPNFQKAITECRSKLPNGGAPPSLSPEQLDGLRAFAQCMRDHGVDMPDPDPNSPTLGFARGGRIDTNNPNFRTAMDACRDKLPFGRGGRGGPGATPSPSTGA